jgi:hypothetical protein
LISEKIDYDVQSQGLYGYGKAIANFSITPNTKSTDIYRYSINYLTDNQCAAAAFTKYIRKNVVFVYHFIFKSFLERNANDINALQCFGVIHEFNQRFTQSAKVYQL